MTTVDTATTEKPRGWLATCWLRLALAVTFLTRLPLPIKGDVSADDLRASMGWYPVIGLGLGAAGWGAYLGLSQLFYPGIAGALVIILLEMATGALHLDGFMDTCDGMGSGAPRERALEIMKDSRVGAMGVFGAVAVLLVKVMALVTLAPSQSVIPLLLGWSTARMVPVINVTFFRYARLTGTGGAFSGGKSAWALPVVLVTTLAAGWLIGRFPGVMLVLVVTGVTLLVQARISRKLGGLTGDVYGMGIELTEALALLVGVLLVRWTFI
ncbi:MAG TPA: adenosylcobinamide-GDP ribazoletransferase [Armatimonadota bacterium]